MKLIIGLGNPGLKHKSNRHNAGHMAIDKLIKTGKFKGETVKKNIGFMNSSGETVKKLVKEKKIELIALYVIFDDLDVPLGRYKIQFGRGPKDHNGLLSVYKHLGSRDFWHVRIGIENRNQERSISGETYTLQNFTTEELKIINQVLSKIGRDLYDRFRQEVKE